VRTVAAWLRLNADCHCLKTKRERKRRERERMEEAMRAGREERNSFGYLSGGTRAVADKEIHDQVDLQDGANWPRTTFSMGK
jgi:hypothetical protein